MAKVGRRPTPRAERFWPKVDIRGPNDCWPWKPNYRNRGGYGLFSEQVNGKVRGTGVHRVAFLLSGGVIPPGYTVDHVTERGCVRKDCCNPGHLEAVPHRVNILRSDGLAAQNARKTQCPKGHPYDYVKPSDPNHRRCSTCEREYDREAARRRRAQRPRKPRVRRTHCPQGHPYSADNVYEYGSQRRCRTCDRDRSREYQRRKAAERKALA